MADSQAAGLENNLAALGEVEYDREAHQKARAQLAELEALQRRGIRVSVVSTISTQPPLISDDLRRQADVFIDLVDLQGKIGRDPSERAGRMQETPRFLERRGAPLPDPTET